MTGSGIMDPEQCLVRLREAMEGLDVETAFLDFDGHDLRRRPRYLQFWNSCIEHGLIEARQFEELQWTWYRGYLTPRSRELLRPAPRLSGTLDMKLGACRAGDGKHERV